jgi:hypothetical protein
MCTMTEWDELTCRSDLAACSANVVTHAGKPRSHCTWQERCVDMDAARQKRPGAPPPAENHSRPSTQSGRHTGCATRKELPENAHTQQRHSKKSATGLPRAGGGAANTSLQARRCRVAPHVITGHAPAQCTSTANKLPSNTQINSAATYTRISN